MTISWYFSTQYLALKTCIGDKSLTSLIGYSDDSTLMTLMDSVQFKQHAMADHGRKGMLGTASVTTDCVSMTTSLFTHGPCDCARQSLLHVQMLACDAIKDKNLTKLLLVLEKGMTGNHLFTEEMPVDVQGESILQLAVREDFVAGVELLLFKCGDTLDDTIVQMAFLHAMKYNLIESIRLFLQTVIKGHTYIKPSDAFRHAMYKMQYDLVEKVLELPDFHVNFEATWGLDRPLHIVIHHNQLHLARLLLQKEAIVDAMDRKGTTPLIVACSFMSVDSARLLLQHGADPSHKACRDLYPHHSPLHATYRFSRDASTAEKIVWLLLAAGLDLHRETWLQSQGTSFNIPEPLHSHLQYLCHQPQQLKMQCFYTIRNHLSLVHGGISLWQLVDQLPVGPIMSKYLRLVDI